jgi:hypothetical protein
MMGRQTSDQTPFPYFPTKASFLFLDGVMALARVGSEAPNEA